MKTDPQQPAKVLNNYNRIRVPVYEDPGESMTEQHHAKNCDINTIMARYIETGVITHIKKYEDKFGDVSGLDFKKSADLVAQVTSEFEELPAFARDFYENDPQVYLNAISTPEGVQELQSLKHPATHYDRDGNRVTGNLRLSGEFEPDQNDQTVENPTESTENPVENERDT